MQVKEAHLTAARSAGRAGLHLAELDKLLHLGAALDDLKCLLAAYVARLDAGMVAVGAHALDNTRALYALLEAAYKIYIVFLLVFSYFCLC